jgi:KH domain
VIVCVLLCCAWCYISAINNIIQDRMRELDSQRSRTAAPTGHPGGPEWVEVAVPNNHVGLIIGRGGSTIKMIQDRTSTHVQIPKTADESDPTQRTIVVSGQSRAAVEEAKREILNVLGNNAIGGGSAPAPSSGSTSGTYGGALGGGTGGGNVVVVIPNDRAGLIIGSRGATIHEIQQRTMTHVQIPQFPDPGSNPPVRTVTITGNPEGCEQARSDIYNLVQVCCAAICVLLSGFLSQPMFCYDLLCSNVRHKLVVARCPYNQMAGSLPALVTLLVACTEPVLVDMVPQAMVLLATEHMEPLPLDTMILLRMRRTINSMVLLLVRPTHRPPGPLQPLTRLTPLPSPKLGRIITLQWVTLCLQLEVMPLHQEARKLRLGHSESTKG